MNYHKSESRCQPCGDFEHQKGPKDNYYGEITYPCKHSTCCFSVALCKNCLKGHHWAGWNNCNAAFNQEICGCGTDHKDKCDRSG